MSPLSHSSVDRFNQCQRAFYHLYVLRDVTSVSGPEAQAGIRVHGVLEAAVKSAAPLPRGVWGDGEDGEEFLEALRKLGAEAEVPLAMDGNGRAVNYRAPDAVFRGKLDVVLRVSKGVLGIDWKTGKLSRFTNHVPQGRRYAALLSALHPGERVAVCFHYLERGPQYTYAGTPVDVESVLAEVQEIREWGESGLHPVPTKSPLCRFCSVPQQMCQYSGGAA